MNTVKQFNRALDDGLSKAIFDHMRNFLMCAFLLAIGTAEFRYHKYPLFDFIPEYFSGLGIIAISFMLIGLNLYDGIRKISKSKYHFILTVVLVTIYLSMSVRVIELTWSFRSTI